MSPDESDRATSAEVLDLLDQVEEALEVVRLYVADSLLHPEDHDGNAGS